ncbi:hypothetical protein GALMADRAFT_93475 [Galerina marginata CBS 339.88]|uniref:BTB domain-containing protein n=1 Tax=Galerina marginata (strain CBS 339.88) TaxID=685588 RepID=A0A067T8V4_GALM3|nr:hypothetical protein GALMADRAFT_93475 [Galerina marginata CBS 339.88]
MSTSAQSHFPSPSKRKRPESAIEPLRSPNYWFNDGNIVIQAQNTQFRVYKGILARHSKVFCDMFDLSQPDSEPLVEGCALVHVSDAPQDWENIFSILYDNDMTHNSTEVFALPTLSSMLRLGRKYDFDKLYTAALERIKIEVPDTFGQWDTLFSPRKTSPIDGHEIELLNVLVEMELLSLLPVVYFICFKKLTLEDIFRGTTQEDGNVVRLSPDSIETLVLGREKISRMIATENFAWVRHYQPGYNIHCSNPTKCDREVLNLLKALSEFSLGPGDAPQYLRQDLFCPHCYKDILDTDKAARQKMWESLPIYFGLPAWNNLQ